VIELDLIEFDFIVKGHDINILRSGELDILGVFDRISIDNSVSGDVEIGNTDDFSLAGAVKIAAQDSEGLENHLVGAAFDSVEGLNSGKVGLPELELFEDFTKVDDVESVIVLILFKVVVDDVVFRVFFFGEELDLVFTNELGKLTEGSKISWDFSFRSISSDSGHSDGGHRRSRI